MNNEKRIYLWKKRNNFGNFSRNCLNCRFYFEKWYPGFISDDDEHTVYKCTKGNFDLTRFNNSITVCDLWKRKINND